MTLKHLTFLLSVRSQLNRAILIVICLLTLIAGCNKPDIEQKQRFYHTPGKILDFKIAGNLAYILDDSTGLHIVDISSKIFRKVGLLEILQPKQIAIYGNYAAIHRGNKETIVTIIDITDPQSPVKKGTCSTGLKTGSYKLAINESHAFIGSNSGVLTIIDIQDKDSSGLGGNRFFSSRIDDIIVADGKVYIALDWYS